TDDVAFTYALNSSNQSSLIQNATCQPQKAGAYTFCAYALPEGQKEGQIEAATLKGKTPLATASLLVNKVSITVTPNWTEGTTPESASQVTLVSTPAVPESINLKDIFDISCSYFAMSATEKAAASGKFAVTAKYKVSDDAKAAVDEFKNNYVVTFESKSFMKKANSAQVNFQSGENGTINGFYTSHYYPMESGSSKIAGTKLRFQAVAKEGYAVDYWIINGTKYEADDSLPNGMMLNDDRDILDIESFDLSKHVKDNALTVKVFYASVSNPVTFSVKTGEDGKDHGSLEAVNSTGKAFTSGTNIRNGSGVTLTATPDEGYVVDQWLVNGRTYRWSGTEEAYRGTTLIIEDIQSPQDVVVFFKNLEGSYKISTSVADEEENEEASLATISAVNAETKEDLTLPTTAKEGTSITFKATVTNDSVNMVKEWQISTDNGVTYETAKGSGGSDTFTLYNVGSDTVVRAIVTKAYTYTLNYQVKIGDTEAASDIASLLATSNGQTLASGSTASAYIPVEFNLTLGDNYYLVGWSSNVDVDETDSTKATIESLTSNVNVTVTIAEKPVVSWETVQNGKVTASMKDPKDETNVIPVENGDHVAPGTDVTFTFTPNKGYVVDTEAVKANDTKIETEFADGNGETTDVRTYTISNIQADQKVKAAFTALDTYSVDYEVVNTIVGQVDGSLSAASGRKGLADYEISNLTSGDKVYEGSDVTFTATPKPGYQVKQWKVNGEIQKEFGLTVTKNTLQVSSVGEDTDVTVEFIQSGDKVTIQADENGKIVSAIAGGKDQVENIESGFTLGENASVTITASANPGYEVLNWTVNDEVVEKDGEPVTDLVYTYKSDATKAGANIRVHFQQIPYQVSWSGKDGTVTAKGQEGSSAKIRGGSEVTFTVTPDEGQMIDYWTVNGVKVEGEADETFTFTVPNGAAQTPAVSEFNIQAVCKEAPFKVNYEQPDANGSLTAKAGSQTIASGDTVEGNTVVTFTAVPDSGYMVGKWTVNGETIDSQENTLDVTVKKDTEVSVTLIPDTYTVTASKNGSGTISVGTDESGSYEAKYGTSLTFTAKADEYWEIGGWFVDGKEVTEGVSEDKTTFTLTDIKADQNVEVQFIKAVYYNVSYGVVDRLNGKLDAKADDQELELEDDNYTIVKGGSDLTFTATPEYGYMVEGWTINGKPVEGNLSTKLVIEGLDTNVDVKVQFKKYTGYLIPEDGAGYQIQDVERDPDDTVPATEIRENGTLTFTVALDKDQGFNMISKLIVNGYDCINQKQADAEVPVTGCDEVKAVANEDGSYTVTIKKVTAAITLDAEVHKLQKVEAVAPTCITEGNIEYWECLDENCPIATKKFGDEHGFKALAEGEEIIPEDKEDGHDFKEEDAVFTWTDYNKKATAKIICSRCQEEKELPCTVTFTRGNGKLTFTAKAEYKGRTYTGQKVTDHILTKVAAKAATCIAEGNIEYWACNDENCADGIRKFADELGNKVLENGKEVIPIDKVNGHDYSTSKVTFQWKDNGSVTAYVTCARCGEHKAVKCTVTKEEGIGKMTYTATVKYNNKTYTEKKTVKYKNAWTDSVLRLQATASKTAIKLKWNAIPKADGYIIYGRECGNHTSIKQLKVIKSGKTITWTQRNLKKVTNYRYYVKAYKILGGKRYIIKNSNQVHVVTLGGTYTNVKQLKATTSSVTLRNGKTKTLSIKQTYVDKNKKCVPHMRALTYTTTNSKVATVTSKGVIKAKGKGSCYIYVTAYSGAYTRVKVTVK
ncbi:MAG: hypothetical protein MR380_02800, partial [Lachnospiraceae bacterium]|nr:hypothetical protein [Lachnospiraceae bacterium]